MMYDRLKYLYESGRINEAQLAVAVSKGWITEQQKNEIIGEIA